MEAINEELTLLSKDLKNVCNALKNYTPSNPEKVEQFDVEFEKVRSLYEGKKCVTEMPSQIDIVEKLIKLRGVEVEKLQNSFIRFEATTINLMKDINEYILNPPGGEFTQENIKEISDRVAHAVKNTENSKAFKFYGPLLLETVVSYLNFIDQLWKNQKKEKEALKNVG
ncbi:antitoxin component HigA of HigAB toxin-antitoxin module [Lachnospiraceae bacterium PF1-22]